MLPLHAAWVISMKGKVFVKNGPINILVLCYISTQISLSVSKLRSSQPGKKTILLSNISVKH